MPGGWHGIRSRRAAWTDGVKDEAFSNRFLCAGTQFPSATISEKRRRARRRGGGARLTMTVGDGERKLFCRFSDWAPKKWRFVPASPAFDRESRYRYSYLLDRPARSGGRTDDSLVQQNTSGPFWPPPPFIPYLLVQTRYTPPIRRRRGSPHGTRHSGAPAHYARDDSRRVERPAGFTHAVAHGSPTSD